MTTPNRSYPNLALGARWTARAIGTLLAALLLTFMIGEGYNPFTMKLADAVHTLFMPVAVVIGLLLAWKWELLGGALTVIGMAGFFALDFLKSGRLPTGWLLYVLALPGLLYLLSWSLRRSRGMPAVH